MKAIVLLSGGLDSTVILAKALSEGRECYALSFDYGQRHRRELDAAKAIVAHYQVPHQVITIDSKAFALSSLVSAMAVPKGRTPQEIEAPGTPNTYVPARNTLFLAYALGQAEILGAQEVYIGVNALDGNYPDCRPSFIDAFQQVFHLGTKQGLQGQGPQLVAPLMGSTKADIVHLGRSLGAPLDLSWSCYDPTPTGAICQQCDACTLRRQGFEIVA